MHRGALKVVAKAKRARSRKKKNKGEKQRREAWSGLSLDNFERSPCRRAADADSEVRLNADQHLCRAGPAAMPPPEIERPDLRVSTVSGDCRKLPQRVQSRRRQGGEPHSGRRHGQRRLDRRVHSFYDTPTSLILGQRMAACSNSETENAGK